MSDPMSHPAADEALEWVTGEGSPESRAAFEKRMAKDAELAELVGDLSDGAAILAMSCPQVAAPEGGRGRLLDRIERLETEVTEPTAEVGELEPIVEESAQTKPLRALPDPTDETAPLSNSPENYRDSRIRGRLALREMLGWAAALVFAIGCAWLWQRNASTGKRLAEADDRIVKLNGDLIEARRSQDLARFEIDALKATIDDFREGIALVVWDAEKQEGVLKLEKMPPIPVDKDYQLWVVDPSHQSPVNAGVVRVDEQGFARVSFKPAAAIAQADKFAISVEQRGGVPQNEGPIVLLSP